MDDRNDIDRRPRGGLTREQLEPLIADGLSVRAIATETGVSATTVRYWLTRHSLRTLAATRRALPRAADRPQALMLECRKHGTTRHFRRSDGYRCGRCSGEHVSARRRRVKAILVQEAGGACRLCGYNRTARALVFHHVDPTTKRFGLAHRGLSQSLEIVRAEAAKCVLLCSNCHAEVESGLADVPDSMD